MSGQAMMSDDKLGAREPSFRPPGNGLLFQSAGEMLQSGTAVASTEQTSSNGTEHKNRAGSSRGHLETSRGAELVLPGLQEAAFPGGSSTSAAQNLEDPGEDLRNSDSQQVTAAQSPYGSIPSDNLPEADAWSLDVFGDPPPKSATRQSDIVRQQSLRAHHDSRIVAVRNVSSIPYSISGPHLPNPSRDDVYGFGEVRPRTIEIQDMSRETCEEFLAGSGSEIVLSAFRYILEEGEPISHAGSPPIASPSPILSFGLKPTMANGTLNLVSAHNSRENDSMGSVLEANPHGAVAFEVDSKATTLRSGVSPQQDVAQKASEQLLQSATSHGTQETSREEDQNAERQNLEHTSADDPGGRNGPIVERGVRYLWTERPLTRLTLHFLLDGLPRSVMNHFAWDYIKMIFDRIHAVDMG
ncbi:hypothetical protein Slin15195_G106570 [Septoria linicola]|uniref:Uncharacterized protein n=1 Tax=Septoria linicola TaxID=215465 RepID=A0A9Q9B1T2_9PEZI|nr:hypothetical protein Slin14017_G069540 [Septoria linicola]USW57338.1 hypothetical protein Slin15195_G106570 [Septoria linicola]